MELSCRKCFISSPFDGKSVWLIFSVYSQNYFFFLAFSVKKLIFHSCQENFHKCVLYSPIVLTIKLHSFADRFKMQSHPLFFSCCQKKRWIFLTKSMKVSERSLVILKNAWTQLDPPSPLLRVTKGIEGLEPCHGRLLHTAVPAPWKWSYSPLSAVFLVFLTPPLVLFSPYFFLTKLSIHRSTPAQQGRPWEWSWARLRKIPQGEIDQTGSWNAPFLHHYSGWAHRRSSQQGSFPTQNPLPHWASIINQPLLHFSHISKKARVLLSRSTSDYCGSLGFRTFTLFFIPHLFMIGMEMPPSSSLNSSKWDLQMGKKNKH